MVEGQVQLLFPGYALKYLEGLDNDPPLTGAHKAYGSLWYHDEHPKIILSCRSIHQDILRRLMSSQVTPVYMSSLQSIGFKFFDAAWLPYEPLEGTDWVVMLNEGAPTNPLRNGYYRFSVKWENRLGPITVP